MGKHDEEEPLSRVALELFMPQLARRVCNEYGYARALELAQLLMNNVYQFVLDRVPRGDPRREEVKSTIEAIEGYIVRLAQLADGTKR